MSKKMKKLLELLNETSKKREKEYQQGKQPDLRLVKVRKH